MNIQNLKMQIASQAGINLPTLMLSQQVDTETGEKQPWLSHWDNDKRVRITFPEEVALKLKDNPDFDGLAFKCETVPATQERAAYTRYVVIIPTSVVMTF